MCQIHFIYNKKGINSNDLKELTKLMCFGSLSGNKDAWGIFNEKKIIKRSGEFNPELINNSLINGKILVGHNRLSTASVEPIIELVNIFKKDKKSKQEKEQLLEKQHHPFKLGNLLMVHNGVIFNAQQLFKKYKINTQIKTDSYAILYLIDHYLKLSNKENRSLKIIDSIQKTSKKLKGWYSVILYDKKDDILYYFIDGYSEFNFNIIDGILIGSTKKINLDYVYLKNKKKKHITPNKNTIYIINNNGEHELFKSIRKLSPSCSEEENLKKEFRYEKPGNLYKKINSLPGNLTDYEISENLKLKITGKKLQIQQLKKYFISKKIKYKLLKNSLILNLDEFYNGK